MTGLRELFTIAPKKLPLSQYEHKRSPVNGVVEEGLFEKILDVVDPRERFVVEFGAGDGLNHSFAKNLIETRGYRALLLEGDPKLAKSLKETSAKRKGVHAREAFITRENVTELFAEAGTPTNFALLCIDVDGIDYYLWEAIAAKYRPDVVCIEFNASFGPRKDFVVPYSDSFVWAGDDYFGASFAAMTRLGRSLGYALVHVTSAGDNLIFVRSELASLFGSSALDPKELYQLPQYGKNGRARNGKGHPASPKTTSLAQRAWYRARYLAMTIPRKIVYAKHDPKGHRKGAMQ